MIAETADPNGVFIGVGKDYVGGGGSGASVGYEEEGLGTAEGSHIGKSFDSRETFGFHKTWVLRRGVLREVGLDGGACLWAKGRVEIVS